MRIHPFPPSLPQDLLSRFGTPEDVFGPNMRFRFASMVLGMLLLVLGLSFLGAGRIWGGAELPFADKLSLGLVVLGLAAIVLPLFVPSSWIFVCPRGLVRNQGKHWKTLEWAEAAKFEDATMSKGAVRTEQCRIVASDGTEWGFISDWVADYKRLVTVLRAKVNSHVKPS